jgi:hypothetical protein
MPGTETPEKMIFKTEEERQAAVDALPDTPPEGVDPDKFVEELEEKMESIYNSEINPDYVPAAPAGDTPANEDPNNEPEITNDELEKNRIKALEEERERVRREAEEYKAELAAERAERKKMAEEIKKIKEAKEKKVEIDNNVDELDKKIFEVSQEMERIRERRSKLDDPYGDEAIKSQDDLISLSNKYTELTNKKNAQALADLREQNERVLKEQENERKRLEEERKAKEAREAEQKTRERQYQAIDEFRDSVDELKGGASYAEMSQQYDSWANEVAQIFYGRNLTANESHLAEVAVQKYLDGTPDLLAKMREKGLTEPRDLRKYLVISETDLLMNGYEFDKNTGTWKEIKNNTNGQRVVLRDHQQAYNELLRKSGKSTQDILKASRDSAENLTRAMQKRAPATELQENHEAGTIEDMTIEEADKIFQNSDEMLIAKLYRENRADPKVVQFERAGKTLGHFDSLKDIFGEY